MSRSRRRRWHSQPRLSDGRRRDPILSMIPEELKALILMDAVLYGDKSPSWVVADILANYYGVSIPRVFEDRRS